MVTLEAHQSVTIKQDVLGSGANNAVSGATSSGACNGTLGQNQTLTSTANGSGSITQNENAASSLCGDGVATDFANMCLDIEQNQGSGNLVATGPNNATFTQTNLLSGVANTSVGPVNQTQSSASGGLVGTVNQYSAGKSTAVATQSETQCEDAHPPVHTTPGTCDTVADPPSYTVTQKQFGPVSKGLGTATQSGNSGDSFTINQASTQNNDTGQNQQNTLQGDCNTPGNCTDTQNTNINGTPGTTTQSGQNVNVTTTCTGSSCTPTCNNSCFATSGHQLTADNVDVAEFGYGGMRANTGTGNPTGDGTGSIAVSGIAGPVSKALLYWNGPTSSDDPNSNAAVSFADTPITGTNIGTASSNCWDRPDLGVAYTNSQSYVADVTSLVSAGLTGGSGTFDLSNFIKTSDSTVTSDINGVALVVFYNDGNAANWRNVVLWSGNDSNVAFGTDPAGWGETLTGVPWPGSGSATLDFIVGDGQNFGSDSTDDGAISVNGTQMVPEGGIFQGASTPAGPASASGDLWDVESFSLPSTLLTTGANSLQVTSPLVTDCLSLVAVAANMPASAPLVLQAPIAAVQGKPVSLLRQAPATEATIGAAGGFIRRK
jgi:hypothetical protein